MKAHGGDVYRAIEETGMAMSEIVDFSASINPLGMPASVIDAIRKGIPELVHYPDPFADRLAVRIAKRLGIAERALLCGNGSTELIYLLVRAFRPRKVLMPQPTFSEYERACRLQEAEIEPFPLSRKRGFAIDRKAFTAAMKGRDMAFLCNPNNPTGSIMERESVLKIAEHARSSGCRLVVDEAFIDFIPEHTIVREASETGSLIVLRSLTKFYALSGLRIGYCVLEPKDAEILRKHKEPWTVNTLAARAAEAAIEDRGFQVRTLQVISEERAFLASGFRSLGIEYFPATANYFLLRTGRARDLSARLRLKGILVRECSNFPGLDETYIRVAIRSRRENERMLKEMSTCVAS